MTHPVVKNLFLYVLLLGAQAAVPACCHGAEGACCHSARHVALEDPTDRLDDSVEGNSPEVFDLPPPIRVNTVDEQSLWDWTTTWSTQAPPTTK